jgi:flagellar motor switch protein FliG
MNLSKQGIRKAAILASSLDLAAADALLEHVDADCARQVRQVMVELGEIDPAEQRRVIDEFYRNGPLAPRQQPAGIELGGQMARHLGYAGGKSPEPTPADARPFCFLQDAETDKLARLLGGERAQTIALVLSHLPPRQAGGVLVRLQPEQQIDVIRRLVDLEETDASILREVEEALRARLSEQFCMQRRRVAGLHAVSGILKASDQPVAAQILENLAAHDELLAEKLAPPAPAPPALRFDDLARLDDATLQLVFEAADPELVLVALVGAPPELIERILRPFSPEEAEILQHRLNHPGPLRLRDVEDARQQIADLAQRLAQQGRIDLPDLQEALFTA